MASISQWKCKIEDLAGVINVFVEEGVTVLQTWTEDGYICMTIQSK